MSASTHLYNAIVLELERRRVSLGLSLEAVNELVGTADRYWSKAVNPDTPSGRRAGWEVLQAAIDVLFCEGFNLRISHDPKGIPTAAGIRRKVLAEAANWDQTARKKWVAQITSLGGKARMAKLSPEERSELGRKAVQARWQRRRMLRAHLHVER